MYNKIDILEAIKENDNWICSQKKIEEKIFSKIKKNLSEIESHHFSINDVKHQVLYTRCRFTWKSNLEIPLGNSTWKFHLKITL